MKFLQVARHPAKLSYHLARNNVDQNKEPRRRGKQNANTKPQTVQKHTTARNITVKSNEGGSNVAHSNAATPRTKNHREQLPTVKMQRTNSNQQPSHLIDATNIEPRSERNTEEYKKRIRNRDQKRIAKFIAEKKANKRK